MSKLCARDTGEVVFSASGRSAEEMRLVVADLREVQGKEIFVRIVDHASAGWGHVNFDHFRFHDEPPRVPAVTAATRRRATPTIIRMPVCRPTKRPAR